MDDDLDPKEIDESIDDGDLDDGLIVGKNPKKEFEEDESLDELADLEDLDEEEVDQW